MKIALAGNPNSGKTTMYNALTGCNETVGNWAGVTVDSKEHIIKKTYSEEEIILVDLPGAYSMSPFTSEESVTSTYIKENNVDAIINIVDATNLSRSLFFTTELLELGIPVVVALNKSDINEKKDTIINLNKLAKYLGCPVIETISTSSIGLKELIDVTTSLFGTYQIAPYTDNKSSLTNKEEVLELDKKRYEFVNTIVKKVEQRKVLTKDRNSQDKIDNLLTNKWLGIPIFVVIMFLVFWISQVGPGVWLADIFTEWLTKGQEWIASLLNSESIWTSILVDGIIGGFIAIIGFLPLVMVMYFLIALLEDCGYMSRVSVVLDPIFKKVGLSGKSVIPFVVGTGCAIPGVMACRTIRSEKERRATALLTPFMPCGAKLPVIALFSGAFFKESPWVGPSMYFIGLIIIFLCALLINAITGNKHKKSYFIIELPEYKLPSLKRACGSMLNRGWEYIVKAGTIILVCNFAIHMMQNFNWNFEVVGESEVSSSILATISTPFAYVLAPVIGVVAWELAAAAITGFIAKENVVGTLAVCFAISNLFNLDEFTMIEGTASQIVDTFGITSVGALAYLMFNLFSPPCFAAIGAMNSELKSKKWLFAGIGLQFAVGFTVSFLVFFFGTLITKRNLGPNWMPILGWSIIGLFAIISTILIIKNNKENKLALGK